jgi:hypothetical protein
VHLIEEIETILEAILHNLHAGLVLEFVAHNGNVFFKVGETAAIGNSVTKVVLIKAMFAFGDAFSAANISLTWATGNSFIIELETHLKNSRLQMEQLLRDHQRNVLAAKENNNARRDACCVAIGAFAIWLVVLAFSAAMLTWY